MPDKDDLDLLLDSALSTYADPGPDAGLGANFEQRVLARIAAAQTSPERKQAPRRTWLPWAIALPLAAGLVLLLLLAPKINHSPSANTQLAHESAPPPSLPRAGSPAETPSKAAHVAKYPPATPRHQTLAQVANSAPRPKLDVFPTPQPLTPQEQAFAAFAIQGPEPERKALAMTQQQIDAPLSIAAIHIPPVQLPDMGTN
jgi:hypothetical protein